MPFVPCLLWGERPLASLVLSSGLALFSGTALAQQAAGAKSGQPVAASPSSEPGVGLSLRVDTTLVQIPIAVTDSLNRFVLGLQKEDFRLLEDGVEQNVAHFSGEDAPLSVGLVFDESGSMDYKLRTSQAAVTHFLKTMNADDETFLVEFGESAKLSVGFTSNTGEIETALTKAQPGGLTALLDAVHTALAEMKKAKNSRKAIVIISDGGDNHSQYTAAQIESLVREADVQIYAMGVFEPSLPPLGLPAEQISGPRLLSGNRDANGRTRFLGRADQRSAERRGQNRGGIAESIRGRLLPEELIKTTDGKYRHVEVKLSQPPGVSPLKAHWRLGYYAPTQ